MRCPTMWYVRPAKPQTSLRIRAVWSEPLLVTWIFYECYATNWTSFRISMLIRRLHRLVWVYTCQNATLLEIWCNGSIMVPDTLNIVLYTLADNECHEQPCAYLGLLSSHMLICCFFALLLICIFQFSFQRMSFYKEANYLMKRITFKLVQLFWE